ncbi:MAG: hypothetical protein ACT4NX_05755 [Deltaproteobacteria bacterium]
MKMYKWAVAALLLLFAGNAAAADSSCNPILAADEARIKLPAWHTILVDSDSDGVRIEVMKVDGKFFQNIGGEWMESPMNFDQAVRTMVAAVRSGEVKLECASAGSDIVDGMPMSVITSRVEIKGAPAADSKLYIGKSDGLLYKQVSGAVSVTYKYKGISAPKL